MAIFPDGPRRMTRKSETTAYGGLLKGSLTHCTWIEPHCAGVTGVHADSDLLPAHEALTAPWRP